MLKFALTSGASRAAWRTRTRPGGDRPWCSARCTLGTGIRGSGRRCRPVGSISLKYPLSTQHSKNVKVNNWTRLLEALQAAVGGLGVGAHNGGLLYKYQLQGVDISGGHHEPAMGKKYYLSDERKHHKSKKQVFFNGPLYLPPVLFTIRILYRCVFGEFNR